MKKKFIFILCILFFISVLGCSSNRIANKIEIENQIKEGMKKLIFKQNHEAKKIFEKVLTEDPKNIEASYYLCISLLRLELSDDAFAIIRNILELDPEYDLGEGIEISYIQYLFKQNNKPVNLIIAEIEKFNKLYPKSKFAAFFQIKLAEMYRDDRKFDEALSYYRKVLDNYPEDKANTEKAEQFVKFIEEYSDYDRKPLMLYSEAKNQKIPIASLDIFRSIIAKYPLAKIIPLVKLEIALLYDHGRLNLFESAIIYYERLIDEYPNTYFAEIGRKNKERLEEIFNQKVLSGKHLEEYKNKVGSH